jgi:tRNA(Ile)-lysidine synthase
VSPRPDPPATATTGSPTIDTGHAVVQACVARCTFPPPGTPLRCAVSGGADSLALAVLGVAAGCDVEVIHVDHGLRPESPLEADVVVDAARRLGVPVRVEQVVVPPGPNLEARARDARRAVLGPGVATGHTADDQAETMLLHLLRGAGLAGMAAMRPGVDHPLLGLRRADTEAVCAAVGLDPVLDPSNDDPAFTRNRVRHEVLPLLADVAGRDVVPLLARSASLARDALGVLDAEADRLIPDPTDVTALRDAPPALAAVAVHRWLAGCAPDGYAPDAASVARVLEVAGGMRRATEVSGGLRVTRRQGRLSCVPVDGSAQDSR